MNELKHLQNVILMMVKDIDEICRNNHIDYFLAGGSALGAIRHSGFIPWDDDLDIGMDPENYDKFIEACKKNLDPQKYYLEEGFVDWPMPFTKIRLRGTVYSEEENQGKKTEQQGIFIDVFPLEHVPNKRITQIWMYIWGKLINAHCLSARGYKSASLYKKIIMFISTPLKSNKIRQYARKQVERYRGTKTAYLGSFYSNERFRNFLFKQSIFNSYISVPFEDTELPVPSGYHEMLTQLFGDYMTPPPISMQQGGHYIGVDFGKY